MANTKATSTPELSYPARAGGLSATVTIAIIDLESLLSVYGEQMTRGAKDRVLETLEKLHAAKKEFAY